MNDIGSFLKKIVSCVFILGVAKDMNANFKQVVAISSKALSKPEKNEK